MSESFLHVSRPAETCGEFPLEELQAIEDEGVLCDRSRRARMVDFLIHRSVTDSDIQLVAKDIVILEQKSAQDLAWLGNRTWHIDEPLGRVFGFSCAEMLGYVGRLWLPIEHQALYSDDSRPGFSNDRPTRAISPGNKLSFAMPEIMASAVVAGCALGEGQIVLHKPGMFYRMLNGYVHRSTPDIHGGVLPDSRPQRTFVSQNL